jgi:uncharacterized protein
LLREGRYRLPSDTILPQMKLADLYSQGGLRLKKDDAKALQLIQDAAEKGYVDAEMELAERYKYGKGVEEDQAEATSWYKRAALHGNRKAQNALWNIHEDPELADLVTWYRDLAQEGKAFGQENLGRAYGLGVGLEQNDAEAAHWYRLAAEQGSVTAQVVLARMYEVGQGVPLDSVEAIKWYQKASTQGSGEAQASLGDMYFYGRGVSRDDTEALHWYEMAKQTFNSN